MLAAAGWWTATSVGVGWYLIIWMFFTVGLVIASAVAPHMLTIIVVLTVVLLGSLGIGAITGNAAISLFGGYEGVLARALVSYFAFAFLINETYGKTVLSVGARNIPHNCKEKKQWI